MPIMKGWIFWALLSALFAAVTAILAKQGVAHIDPNLATAVRTTVVLVMAWSITFASGQRDELASLDKLSVVFVLLLAWPLLGERLSLGKVVGGVLIALGAVVLTLVP